MRTQPIELLWKDGGAWHEVYLRPEDLEYLLQNGRLGAGGPEIPGVRFRLSTHVFAKYYFPHSLNPDPAWVVEDHSS